MRHKISTFTVDGELFGVDAMLVQEMSRHMAVTPVPLAPPIVAGVMNLRGEVVTALDLRSVAGAELYGWLETISVFGFLTAHGVRRFATEAQRRGERPYDRSVSDFWILNSRILDSLLRSSPDSLLSPVSCLLTPSAAALPR